MFASIALLMSALSAVLPDDDPQKSGPVCNERIGYRLGVDMVTHTRSNVTNSIE